jgi:hypothetical protein
VAPGAAATQKRPDSAEALRDLCHGKDLCWLVVLTPPQNGAFLVQAKFPDANRFILPGDAYCDRREYWHVAGSVHTLIAADCSEQWGPDSQGPAHLSLEGGKIKLTYLEWSYDLECEKAAALLDFATAKVISMKRSKGTASDDRADCRHLKPLKSPPLGNGKTVPLVPLNADSSADVQGAIGSGGRSGR